MGKWLYFFIINIVFIIHSDRIFSKQNVSFGVASGLMQQPTSSYYHLIYGGFISFHSNSNAFISEIAYYERPVFKSVGYSDQEQVWSLLVGTSLIEKKHFIFSSKLGIGHVYGFICKTTGTDLEQKTRSFKLWGLMSSVNAKLKLDSFFIALEYKFLVGLPSKQLLKYYVAWPFNFTLLKFGWHI